MHCLLATSSCSRNVMPTPRPILERDRGCSAEEAFDALVRTSQEAHRKLREVAQRLVDEVAGG